MGRHKAVLKTGKAETLADQRTRILGLTQEEMARRIGCTQGYLSLVESGKQVPAQIKKWAKEYRLSLKRFKALVDNQFLLPLWRFAVQTIAADVAALEQGRKAEAV